MFTRCDFLLGSGNNIVIVVPGVLPDADTYTVSVCDSAIRFKAGYDLIAELSYQDDEIFKRICESTQVGLVEYPGRGELPDVITHVAYVEVRRQ